MQLVDEFVEEARTNYNRVYPSTEQLRSPGYRVFHLVIPHGQRVAPPGSAHAAIEDAVLDRARGELSLHHDMRPNGQYTHCGVYIDVNAVN